MLQLLVLGTVFLAGYFIIERIGLFDVRPLSNIQIIYSIPFLTGSLFFLIMAILYLLSDRRGSRFRRWAYLVAVSLIVSGLWVSYFTRFSTEVVITEGQAFYSGDDRYIQKSIYKGRFARVPDIDIRLIRLSPEFSNDGSKVNALKGEFIYFSKAGEQEEIVITNGLPRFIDGIMVRIKDFGYSPRFVLKSKDGKVLHSSFVYMRLFPEGNEDFFRLLSPHTYYLRYYPSRNEVLRLRIIRNKDIVFNRDIRLHEDAPFDNGRISFEEVRSWTRLSISRDWGAIISLAGIIILLFTFLTKKLARRKCKFL